jgi:hypothetical protein
MSNTISNLIKESLIGKEIEIFTNSRSFKKSSVELLIKTYFGVRDTVDQAEIHNVHTIFSFTKTPTCDTEVKVIIKNIEHAIRGSIEGFKIVHTIEFIYNETRYTITSF